jgi:tripartite-type tricarboxylate transporter receptor subunit TctC
MKIHSQHRRMYSAALSALAAGLMPVSSALGQQEFPDRTVRIVVAGAAGGGTDFLARLIAERLAVRWKQPVLVENRAGASGMIGTKFVMASPPDGYTLILGHNATHAIVPALIRPQPYDAIRDFTPVSLVATAPDLLVVGGNSSIRSVADLIAMARAKSDSVTYASPGVGLPQHLNGFIFGKSAGAQMRHVAYKGSAPALTDLIGGHITMMFVTAGAVVQHVREGRVRAIAITSPNRSALFPEVPTMTELGMPELDVVGWFGLFGPANLAPRVVSIIGTEVAAVMGEPGVRAKIEAQVIEPVVSTPAQFAEIHRKEVARWTEVVRQSGVTAQE